MGTKIELEGLTRRDLLKLSLAAGTLGTAGALLPGCSPPLRKFTYGYPLDSLTDLDYSVLMKAAEIVLPSGDTGLPDWRGLPVLKNVDRAFSMATLRAHKGMSSALALFEYGAFFIGWHLRPFTRLSPEKARAYLASWRTGKTIQKSVYAALTKLLLASYWQEEPTWKPVGYEGPVYRRFVIPSLGNATLPQD